MTREEMEAAARRVIADGPVPLSKLAKKVPADRDGRTGHVSTTSLIRWIMAGRKGVHLDGARLAGKGWCSSEAALARFSVALTMAEAGISGPPAPCERERRARAALAELDRLRTKKG